MANHVKRRPAQRMAELLEYERKRLTRLSLRAGGDGLLTEKDFEAAWDDCWEALVVERAWPHFTPERRGWREAQLAMKPILCRWFLGQTTSFAVAVDGIRSMAQQPGVDQTGYVAGLRRQRPGNRSFGVRHRRRLGSPGTKWPPRRWNVRGPGPTEKPSDEQR